MAKKKRSIPSKAVNRPSPFGGGRVVTSSSYNPQPARPRVIAIPQGGFAARPAASLQVMPRPISYAPLKFKPAVNVPFHAPLAPYSNATVASRNGTPRVAVTPKYKSGRASAFATPFGGGGVVKEGVSPSFRGSLGAEPLPAAKRLRGSLGAEPLPAREARPAPRSEGPKKAVQHDVRNSSPTRDQHCKQRPERERRSSGGRTSREFIPWCGKK